MMPTELGHELWHNRVSKNIWDLYRDDPTCSIVIPTNLGYKRNGCNVMGRGLAKQAARRFTTLPLIYGTHCFQMAAEGITRVVWLSNLRLWMFPVKPLNKDNPSMSWKQPASLELIQRSLESLAFAATVHATGTIYIPFVGCGNGGLLKEQVYPLLYKCLNQNKFCLVDYP